MYVLDQSWYCDPIQKSVEHTTPPPSQQLGCWIQHKVSKYHGVIPLYRLFEMSVATLQWN